LNGELVAKARINGSLTGHGEFGVELDVPDFVQMDVGPEDWWETQWSGIPTSLLQPGENVISAVLHKAETGGSPSFYFDLQVRAWTDIGWVKLPYLHQASQTGVTVSWETTVPTRGRIEVSNARGSAVRTVLDSFLGIHHEVVVDGLKPGTDYRYRVVAIPEGGAEELKGDLYGFSTAPREDQGFSFLFYGDSRTGKTVHRKLANLMVADRAEYDSNMVVHAGDIVSWGYAWDRWQERFFAPAWPLLSQVPIYPTVGNHELNQKLYYDYFDLPGNESWYHFRYGIADFFAVNSNVDYKRGSEQYKWFEAALKASEAPWKVVFLHHPPFACATSRKPGNTRVKEHLVPLMEEYGVDLVLLGHDHLYGRSRKVNGVTYVISGGGGSALYSAKPDSIMQVCEKRYNYVRFHVSEEAIKWVAIAEDGQIIEEYEINP
jgi:predicted phosphodiesterase